MRINLYILDKRYRLTGTAAPANKLIAAHVPEEWSERVKAQCKARGMTRSRYLRDLVRGDLERTEAI